MSSDNPTEPSLDSRIAEILKDARIVSIKPEVSYDGELWQWNQKAKAAIKTLVEGEVLKARKDAVASLDRALFLAEKKGYDRAVADAEKIAEIKRYAQLSNPNEERS